MSYMSTHLHCSRQCVGKQNKDPCHNGGYIVVEGDRQ